MHHDNTSIWILAFTGFWNDLIEFVEKDSISLRLKRKWYWKGEGDIQVFNWVRCRTFYRHRRGVGLYSRILKNLMIECGKKWKNGPYPDMLLSSPCEGEPMKLTPYPLDESYSPFVTATFLILPVSIGEVLNVCPLGPWKTWRSETCMQYFFGEGGRNPHLHFSYLMISCSPLCGKAINPNVNVIFSEQRVSIRNTKTMLNNHVPAPLLLTHDEPKRTRAMGPFFGHVYKRK